MTRAEELAEKAEGLRLYALANGIENRHEIRSVLAALSELVADAEALAEALERLLDRREVNETWSETYMARDALARCRGEKPERLTREEALEQMEPDDYPFRGQP